MNVRCLIDDSLRSQSRILVLVVKVRSVIEVVIFCESILHDDKVYIDAWVINGMPGVKDSR